MTTQQAVSRADAKDISKKSNVSEYSNHFKINSTIDAEKLKPLNNSNYEMNSIKRVNKLEYPQIMTIDDIKNNYSTSYGNLDRGKYRRSISQQRNITFNDNLSKIVNENFKKEFEIENIERIKQRIIQGNQNNELK